MQTAGVKGYRLSLQQARLWAIQQWSQAEPGHCMVRLSGKIELFRLQQALALVVQRHGILRTSFSCPPGLEVPLQVVRSSSAVSCTLLDLQGHAPQEQQHVLEERHIKQVEEVKRGEGEATLRAELVRFSEEEHVLLLALPALCTDGYTFKALIEELQQAYALLRRGGSFAEEPLQYVDVAAWQEELLHEEEAAEALAYWQQVDLSTLSQQPLPPFLCHQGPLASACTDFTPHLMPVELAPELSRQLQRLAQHREVSLEVVLLAGYLSLLTRVGVPSPSLIWVACDGRPYEELAQAFGLYTRFLPLLSPELSHLSCSRLLQLLSSTLAQARQHQLYFRWPESSMQEGSALPSCLYSFSFEQWPASWTEEEPHHPSWQRLTHASWSEPFALHLSAVQQGDDLQIQLAYHQAIVSRQAVEELAQSLPVLLQALCVSTQHPVQTLPWLSLSQQAHLRALGQGPTLVAEPPSVVELFEQQAARFPQQLALLAEDGRWSYEQLNTQANQLAHFLRQQGVGPEQLVALCLPRSGKALIAMLAVLKAGGTYVPLESEQPAARLALLLAQLPAHLLLTQRSLLAQLSSWTGPLVCWEELEASLAPFPTTNPDHKIQEEHLAYVVYTSGSTGQPKGVLVRHAGLLNYALAISKQLDAQPGWRWASVSTLSADLGNTAIFGAWVSGGTVQLVSYEQLTSASRLASSFASEAVQVLKIVPSHLAALLTSASDQQQARALLPTQALVLGGEVLPPSLLEQLNQLRGSCRCYNHYGPTETTVGVLLNPLALPQAAELSAASGSVPLGRPLANIQVYVLDADGELVAPGVPGELYVAGPAVARGYLMQPAETAERFVARPCSQTAGQRLYRTGDRVRWREDGQLEFLGRLDSQIKLRGYRIEVGEIEAVLRQHPAVREAVVQLVQGETEQQLAAYVVSALGERVSREELRGWLAERLPTYMLPTAYVMVETLPLTANGKIDRQRLPLPEKHNAQTLARSSEARSPIEEMLIGIWEDILKVRPIGIYDNFAELGGHSLLATQIISRLRIVLQVEIPLLSLFEAPTIAGLAKHVEEALHHGRNEEILPLVPVSRDQDLPLSFAQQRLWFLNQLQPDSAAYNILHAVRLQGELNFVALKHSLEEVMRRHESLRTCFQSKGDQPVQIIVPPRPFRLPLVDLTALRPEEREREGRLLARQETRQPFDLAHGPLLRVTLLLLGENDHAIVLTLHHIVSDAWSRGVLMQEVSTLYNAFAAGEPSPLPELLIQYADFALWQRRSLQGEVLDTQLGYWKQQLEGLAPLELPTDYPRPLRQNYRGAHLGVLLPPALRDDLKLLSQQEGATLFMTLLAAFQVLLARYSGQDDIAIGTPIANRTLAEIEDLIGFFVNTLVLRVDLSGNPGFRDLLKRVRETCLGAYAHQDLPFEKLVEVLQPERDLSRPPLFQVMMGLQHVTRYSRRQSLQGLTLSNFSEENLSTKFDLTLALIDSDQGLYTQLEYNTDLFKPSTIKRMLGQWEVLLSGIVAAPEQSLWTLPLLTQTERQYLLNIWNATQQPYPMACFPTLFQEQVQHRPDSVALVFQQHHLSYAHLNRRTNQLAHALRAQGIGPEVRVGVCLERSLDLLIAMLATFKAGGVYVPLDPRYPQERLHMMLLDSQPSLLLCHSQDDTLDPSFPRLELPTDWTQIASLPEYDLLVPIQLDNAAYLIYTSGSTGKPKGVIVTHRGLGNLARIQAQTFGVGPDSHVLQFSSISFDASVWEITMALLNGASLYLFPQQRLLPGPELSFLLEEQAISIITLPPSALGVLPLHPLPQLTSLVVAGEACSSALVERWQPGRQFYNAYGPTETTVCASIGLTDASEGQIPAIGRALSNTQLYVLDRLAQPTPIGVVGELYIGGIGLARGYLGRPDLTAERFVPHPWSEQGGERLYRTGDRVRYRSDGQLVFLGRQDSQIKLRGYRIELGEIETTLSHYPAIRDCVVIVWEKTEEDKRLVAYVTPRQPQELQMLETSELRSYLANKLPDYMIPATFIVMETLPISPNGKVNRAALPSPDTDFSLSSAEPATALQATASSTAPRTPIEELVAAIWSDMLGIEQVSIHDNFFELGGHSLLVTQIISRIRTTLQMELPVSSLFETPTLEKLAERIEQALREEQGVEMPPLVSIPRTRDLPLSFAQQRLWFIDQLEPGNAAYNIPQAVRLTGKLHTRAFYKSLAEVIRRHESLRTTFQFKEDQPVQVIGSAQTFRLPVINLTSIPHERRQKEAQRLALQEALFTFDLAQGPLLRVALLQLSADEHLFLLTMHHIISDGWSMRVFVREMTTLYNAFVAGEPSALPELPIQYADFALWQRQWLQGEALARQVHYWKQQLEDLAPLNLLTDYPRPAVQRYQGARMGLLVPADVRDDLKFLSQQEGVTLFMTLLAAFQVLLTRYSGQSDIAVGTDIANRTRVESEGLIGFFVNTLVLRTDLSGNPSFAQLLGRVRKVCLDAYMHQDVPFEKVVEILQPERDLSRSPLFQVMLSLEQMGQQVQSYSLQGLVLESLPREGVTAKFDLTLTLKDVEQGLYCVLEYATDLFAADTIRRVLGHFHTLLAGIAADSEQRLSDLPLLIEAERYQLLNEWRGERVNPVSTSLSALFEGQVARTPEKVALAWQEEQLTYAELDRRANQLARHLRSLGVGPEVLVGLYMERSIAMITTILAIFKAGGAYVPLDPAYPQAYIDGVLADAQVQIIATTSALNAQIPSSSASLLHVESVWQAPVHSNEEIVSSPAVDQSLAYVIYTSGSTGRPKGAMLHQAGMLNHLFAKIDTLKLCETDVVAQTASHCFDISIWQFFAVLLVGGQVQIISDELAHDPPALLQQVMTRGISVLEVVPSLLRALLEDIEYQESDTQTIQLRTLVVTGEAVSPHLCRSWLERYEHTPIINAYGPTECSDDVTHLVIDRLPLPYAVTVPIGRPIANMHVYILDSHFSLVPVGVPGQLYVDGIGVGRGYLNDPVRTATVFVPNPFSQQAGARLYQTGDMGYYLPDGQIAFIGRVDHQVKLRGYRIELAEIEAVLASHPDVREAVVLLQASSPSQSPRLLAYLVAPDQPPTSVELRAFVTQRLPDYMMPAAFVLLPALPLTANGKLDRRALPEPPSAVDIPQPLSAQASNPLEELVASVWSEVLGQEEISSQAHFFELGGHSLLATRVIARLRRLLSVELPVRLLFETPTLAAFTQRIEQQRHKLPPVSVPPLRALPRPAAVPLSFAQQRLWFVDRLQPNSPAYIIPYAVRMRGRLAIAALQASLTALLQRHESLRTRFGMQDDQPVQIITPPAQVALPLIDLQGLPPAARQSQSRTLEQQASQQPFDLARGPLLRTRLLRLSEEEHIFLLSLHHIVSDGWSLSVLVRDLSAFYNAQLTGSLYQPPELPIQYADFALWQRQWLQGEVLEEQLTYWRRQLHNLSPLRLPLDFARPPLWSARGASHAFQLSPELSTRLLRVSQQEGVTLFMTLLAAFQLLLARLSGQDNIAVGTDIANRTQVELEALIGFFVNVLVLRTDFSGSPSVREVLAQVREVVLGASSHQDLPFELLVETLGEQQSLDRMPLVQVLFVMQNVPAPQGGLNGLQLSSAGGGASSAKFDLALFMQQRGQEIHGAVVYNRDLLRASTVATWMERYRVLLELLVADPERPIATLDIYTESEKTQQAIEEQQNRKELKNIRGKRSNLPVRDAYQNE